MLSSDQPTTASLLRVGTIEFSSSVPTAAMLFNPRTGTAIIKLNQEFVSQKADKPLRLAALILHELFHHLLHHYVFYPNDMITNIGQDAIINALICRLAPSYQQLFNECYVKNEFPSNLLRPGANLRRIEHVEIRELIAVTYKVLYRKVNRYQLAAFKQGKEDDIETLTTDDVCNMLIKIRNLQENAQASNLKASKDEMDGLAGLVKDWWKDDSKLQLLGNHNHDEENDPFNNNELDEDHVNDLADMLNGLKDDIRGNPNAKGLFSKAFKIDEEAAPEELLEAMAASLREDVMRAKDIIETVVGARPNMQSVIPKHLGRKEVLMLSQGIRPIFYPAFSPEEKPQKDVIIYIDVSGSMGDQANFLVMLMAGFKSQIGTEFYQFSTEIAPIAYHEFLDHFEKTGQIFLETTGGTDFDPIFLHAQEKGYKKILLITDGAANISDEMKEFGQSIETYTVFTNNHRAEPLTETSSATWVMPNINQVKVTN